MREASVAVAQLRRTNSGARVCLVANQLSGERFWDDFVPHPDPQLSFRDKLALSLCPYSRFVYLDTDVHAVGELSEIFQLLDHFDFAGHQLYEGHDSPISGVPDAFPEFQGAVLAFRRSPAVEEFFTRWRAHYDAFRAPGRPDRDAYINVTDQKSLRIALYESALRIAVLGPEYDFSPAHVSFACASVRVLHGRSYDFVTFSRRLNARLGNRVYHPQLDTLLHAETSAAELRRIWRWSTLQLVRRLAVTCTPVRLRNYLRRSRAVRRLFLGERIAP